jgi:hypothetical protein
MAESAMTFEKFLKLVYEYHQHHATFRYGQCVMNVLHSVRPDLYDRASTENLDVFYTSDSAEIEATLSWLEQRLNHDAPTV